MVLTDKKEEQRKERADERELLQKRLEALQLESEVTLLQASKSTNRGDSKAISQAEWLKSLRRSETISPPGSPVILVQPDSGEDKMTFVVFISSEQVKPVKENMDTELQLSAFPPTKFGKLMAKVKGLSPMPLSSSA